MPMVREASKETILVVDGFSCKTQIEQLTDRRGLHTAQLIKMAMEHGSAGVSGSFPERAYPDVHPPAGGVAKGALLAAGAAGAAAVTGTALARRRR